MCKLSLTSAQFFSNLLILVYCGASDVCENPQKLKTMSNHVQPASPIKCLFKFSFEMVKISRLDLQSTWEEALLQKPDSKDQSTLSITAWKQKEVIGLI